MSWRTNSNVILLRNVGRALGLNRLLGYFLSGDKYEDKFQSDMLSSIKPGDVVWDVGANVGLYTLKFSEIVGPSGKVFAYEPSPINLQKLRKATESLSNVTVMPFALGEVDGTAVFSQGGDELGATSRLVDKNTPGKLLPEVKVFRGDSLVSSGQAAVPSVIKIDTEGFELEVLKGLGQTLKSKSLKSVSIEVHFSILRERGEANAPASIEGLLLASGFSVKWPDASHIVATRTI